MFEAYRASQNAGKGGAPKRTVRVYAAPMGAGQASYAGGAGVEDQQGKVADTTAMYKQSRLMQRSESISDGKKVHLTGSTTRQEKHWSSNVFGEPLEYSPRRKLLGGQSSGKEGLGFCDPSA